ncbi:MAG: 30S ribosomal protein S20 [Gammaproteobacteria bacterium]|nr:30S ribosomal protein S20 [Gammaproteobacteria bacterium]MCH9743594.1 30S ribosomal protein S20 [Gammaproteobacteria bacterium]
MANSAQARKRDRQMQKRRLHNHSQKSEMRSAIKKVLTAIDEKKSDIAKEAFKAATVLIDRLAGRNIIKLNKAARIKSRLNARVKACQ